MTMPRVNLYGAGPPCQPLSNAGKKRGLETHRKIIRSGNSKKSQNIVLQAKEDPKNPMLQSNTNSMLNRRSLMWCCLRWWKVFWGKNFGRLSSASGWICYLADVLFFIIPKNKRPNAILLRLNGVMDGHGRKYYNVHAAVLNASYFGLPQARQRLFIIALRRRKQVAPFKFPSPWKKAVNLSMVVNKKFCGGRKRRRILVLKKIQQIEFWRLWVQQSYPPLFESFS